MRNELFIEKYNGKGGSRRSLPIEAPYATPFEAKLGKLGERNLAAAAHIEGAEADTLNRQSAQTIQKHVCP